MDSNLAKLMINRANLDNLSEDHELRIKAKEFEKACEDYFAVPQMCSPKVLLGCWARARRAWSDYTGDFLI